MPRSHQDALVYLGARANAGEKLTALEVTRIIAQWARGYGDLNPSHEEAIQLNEAISRCGVDWNGTEKPDYIPTADLVEELKAHAHNLRADHLFNAALIYDTAAARLELAEHLAKKTIAVLSDPDTNDQLGRVGLKAMADLESAYNAYRGTQ